MSKEFQMTRPACSNTSCMANYEGGRCFAQCGNPETNILDKIITQVDEAVVRVNKYNGNGAVGALLGLADHLKDMRRKM